MGSPNERNPGDVNDEALIEPAPVSGLVPEPAPEPAPEDAVRDAKRAWMDALNAVKPAGAGTVLPGACIAGADAEPVVHAGDPSPTPVPARTLVVCLVAVAVLLMTALALWTRLSAEQRGSRPSPARQVDINQANAAELALLPGVGPVTAAAIVADRAVLGAFTEVDALVRVHGIGPKTLERVRPYVNASRPEQAHRVSSR